MARCSTWPRPRAKPPRNRGARHLPKVWQKVAADWRLKQLQYTWLRAVADAHTDFWEVTQNGLDWALEAVRAAMTRNCESGCWRFTGSLSAYPEVPAMLAALKARGLSDRDPVERIA